MRLTSFAAVIGAMLLASCGADPAPDVQDENPASSASPAEVSPAPEETGPPSLTEVLEADPSLSTFWAAVQLAGLAGEMDSGELTVFAPSNEAFAALPDAASLEVLGAPENRETLKSLLRLHIVQGTYASRRLEYTDQSLMSLAGRPLAVVTTGSVTTVGGAVVLRDAGPASNGEVYVVDALVLPAN